MESKIKMEYLYRDSDNYKAYGILYLSGKFESEFERIIVDCLESGELFIAEQVNIPVLYSQLWEYSNGPTIADHPYHEFISLSKANCESDKDDNEWGNIDDLLKNFLVAKGNWDPSKSIHFGYGSQI